MLTVWQNNKSNIYGDLPGGKGGSPVSNLVHALKGASTFNQQKA